MIPIKIEQIYALLISLIVSLVASPLVLAQSNSILMEACNEMQDKAKRLECFRAASSPPSVLEKKPDGRFDAIKRAHGNMIATLTAGMNFNTYQLAVIELSKEIEQFKREAGMDYPLALDNFNEALSSYSDASKLWEASINFYSNRSFSSTFINAMPVSLTGTKWIADKYSIPLQSDFFGMNPGIPVDSSRLRIWDMARERFENGLRALPQ